MARKFKPKRKISLPRGQKPMVSARPQSDKTASNALSTLVGGPQRQALADGLTRKQRKIRTHGPLGNIRVDKKTHSSKEMRKKADTANSLLKSGQKLSEALQLNTALKPAGVVHKRGKKGKHYAEDKATLEKIVATVTARMDEVHATKIERAQELERIRDAKRAEIEKREQMKIDKLEKKKSELKSRNKKAKSSRMDIGDAGEFTKRSKGRVSFAV
ncbi:uncharacterized protein V1516DRAFT_679486 [Lipomyces oligophaga]|uniref:uncharacterized protein n=1 Tax=Lipomyces oligophaga TaxID=45792 RepID=UPI0034CEE44B